MSNCLLHERLEILSQETNLRKLFLVVRNCTLSEDLWICIRQLKFLQLRTLEAPSHHTYGAYEVGRKYNWLLARRYSALTLTTSHSVCFPAFSLSLARVYNFLQLPQQLVRCYTINRYKYLHYQQPTWQLCDSITGKSIITITGWWVYQHIERYAMVTFGKEILFMGPSVRLN